ncbi:unnamed protein product [Closterium sp. NIES-65]|nr:unnamed protein product [Closterium sp. NIES-65]
MLEILVSGGEWCLGGGAGECGGVVRGEWERRKARGRGIFLVGFGNMGSGSKSFTWTQKRSPALAPEGTSRFTWTQKPPLKQHLPFFLRLLSPLREQKHVQQQHPAFTLPHALSSSSPRSPLPFSIRPLPLSFTPLSSSPPLILLSNPPLPFPQGLVVVTPAAAFLPNPFPNSLIQPPTPFPQGLGLVVVKGEEATRIYHLHAHLTGDSRGSSGISSVVAGSGGSSSSSSSVGGSAGVRVIEQNTCYRGQWGESVRCEGFASTYHEERGAWRGERGGSRGERGGCRGREWVQREGVGADGGSGCRGREVQAGLDGQRRCEKWSRERARTEEDQERMDGAEGADGTHLDTEKLSGWQRQVMKQADKEVTEEWPFPFHEDRLFVLVVRAGWEGFHVSVDGNHVASFQYRSGNPLEEATAVAISGAIRLKSFVATSLPLAPPLRTADLEASESLKAPAVRGDVNVSMFIGILSATNHFAERTAVRKTWLQHPQIRSGEVVARFFLALHPSIQVNVEVHKEAALYGDMVVLPFIDRYDLVVLKTIAICEFGLRNVSTNYIMKVDDDNFVRLDAVFDEIRFANHASGLYMGNINEFHKPLREGKWAVSEEEWPETNYPPYANGPGYIITRDIADFIVRMKEYKMLRIFKMEDVSMGMWVVQYGINNTIHYIHNWRFCQFGCMDDYLTAHYQSPRQMLCMWTKLSRGEARCCT